MHIVGLKIKNKDLEKRSTLLHKHVTSVLEGFIKALSGGSVPSIFTKFLVAFTEEGSTLPDNYFTDFEIKRLHWSSYGTLK